MIYLLRIQVIFWIWCLSSLSYALYSCPQSSLLITHKREIKQFFTEVEQLLPKKMITRIQSKQTTIMVFFDELSKQSQKTPNHLGFFNNNTHHIYLDNSLLKSISTTKKQSNFPSDLHLDPYKKAMATLIHETTHLYDFLNIRSKQEKKRYQSCQDIKTKQCRVIRKDYHRHTTLSEQLAFKKETKWPSKNPNQKNTTIVSSPNAHEQENIYEYLAVNMEYFLLDSDYKKKRPSLYYVLARHFKQDDKYQHRLFQIKPFTYLHPNTSEDPIDVHPKYIHHIDYIIVDKGSDRSTNWGHSLIRLRGCSQDKTSKDQPCLKKNTIDLVISFAADLENKKLNPIKGVFGGYASRAHLFTYESIKKKYTLIQNRHLHHYPLRLTKTQKYHLIYKLLDSYWNYSGSYQFFTINCATELRDILQAVFTQPSFQASNTKTPQGILRLLTRHHLINKQDITTTYRITKKWQQLIHTINTFKAETQTTLPRSFATQPARSRQQTYLDLLQNASTLRQTKSNNWLNLFQTLLTLEKKIYDQREAQYQHDLLLIIDKKILSKKTLTPNLLNLKQLLDELKHKTTYTRSDYGIPLKLRFNNTKQLDHDINQAIYTFATSEKGQQHLGSSQIEVKQTIDNIEKLNQELFNALMQ